MHKEIGGYLELERFTGPMLHEKALALSSGRACLSYLIEQRKIRKIALPDFNCDIVEAAGPMRSKSGSIPWERTYVRRRCRRKRTSGFIS